MYAIAGHKLTTGAALLALAACTTPAPPAPEPAPVPGPPAGPTSGCPVIESRNWHAWIDRMPGPDATPTLNISGEVDLPTPGYTTILRAGPADRMMPPGLRFRLETGAPQGIVTQVVTPTEVSYRQPTPHDRIREIMIRCGDRTLATIPDVMITE